MKFKSTATVRRAFLGLVPIIMVMLGYGEVFMSQAKAAGGVKNILLVHGGFVDGSGWQGVYNVLKKDGYDVSIVQNPTTSLADDVAVTKRTLAAQNGPAILVGHSYGGVVITEAGTDPKVAGLVYIAAFAPDKGESVSTLIKNPRAWCAGAPDPAAGGRLPVPRQGEVPRVVRWRREPGDGGVHGRLAGAVGCERARRRRSASRRGGRSPAGTC